jgi:hypothetical protein
MAFDLNQYAPMHMHFTLQIAGKFAWCGCNILTVRARGMLSRRWEFLLFRKRPSRYS